MSAPLTAGEKLANFIFWGGLLALSLFWRQGLVYLLYLVGAVAGIAIVYWICNSLWWRFWSTRLLDHRFVCTSDLPLFGRDDEHQAMLSEARKAHRRISEAGACSRCGPWLGVMRRVKTQQRILAELDAETDAALHNLITNAGQ